MMCPHCGDENRRTHKFIISSDHEAMTTRLVWRYCPQCRKSYMITMTATTTEYKGRSKQVELFKGEADADD